MERRPSAVVVSDGGVDLPESAKQRYGIRTLPLLLRFGDTYLKSGVDISADEFYRRLRAASESPTTSQPSAGDYLEFYRAVAVEGLPILSFHLSGALSGSIASARVAREMLPELDIRIIDTSTLSAAMALQVMVAAEMAQDGASPEQIIAQAKVVGEGAEIFYTLDTLDYLRRGGRIGRVAGYVGSLLGIRPIITVDKSTGTYVATGRARSFRLAASKIVDTIAERVGEGAEVSCIVVHGDCADEAARLIELMRSRMKCVMVEEVRANPSLGVHVGPDTIGIAYFPGRLPLAALQPELLTL